MRAKALWLSAGLASLAPGMVVTGARAETNEGDLRVHEEILALHRIELRPYGGGAVVANSENGAFIGGDVSYRWTRLFALGADAAWYAPFEPSGGANASYPLNALRWSADLDAYVVPLPAHSRDGSALGAFEPYLLGGVGLLASRPIAVVDPVNRHFGDNALLDLSIGVGVRVFTAERVAFTFEARDVMYFDKVENRAVVSGPDSPASGLNSPLNPATWYSPNTRFTQAFQVRLGASFFLL